MQFPLSEFFPYADDQNNSCDRCQTQNKPDKNCR
jgi:hypothetical protein